MIEERTLILRFCTSKHLFFLCLSVSILSIPALLHDHKCIYGFTDNKMRGEKAFQENSNLAIQGENGLITLIK